MPHACHLTTSLMLLVPLLLLLLSWVHHNKSQSATGATRLTK
jgi:hypothetical protein